MQESLNKDEPVDFYEKYDPAEVLGTGLSSVVRRCVLKGTEENYAVKIIDKFSEKGQAMKGIDVVSQVKAEIKALSKVAGHSNIINLVDVYESSAFFFLVFEMAQGGELFDYLTDVVTIQEKEARKMMYQLLGAVHHMHQRSVVHRDLKPENILLDPSKKLIVSDFGFAVELKEGQSLRDLCGTPGYLAPEVLRCTMYDDMPGYGFEVDLWACGVILYTILVGFAPFWHRRQIVMLRNIMEGNFKLGSPEWDDISEGPRDLINRLLVVDPQKRLTAEQALAHPWFEGIVSQLTPKRKTRKRFKAVAVSILTMKELYYTYHLRHHPMKKETVIEDPYGWKPVRKLIDGCAFKIYAHWVKRSNAQIQNRAALFENSPKQELKHSGLGAVPAFPYHFTSPWVKRGSSIRLSSSFVTQI